jgi:hypothetical protein
VATHAIRAAGGVPSPLDAALCAVETAGQLAESGARMVITAPPLADTALAAVDRSWVRQVFSFVDAPGATRFSDLLGLDMIRPSRGRPDDVALLPFSRGQDGRLRPVPVSHRELVDLVDRADQCRHGARCGARLAASHFGLDYGRYRQRLLRGATVVAGTGTSSRWPLQRTTEPSSSSRRMRSPYQADTPFLSGRPDLQTAFTSLLRGDHRPAGRRKAAGRPQ